MVEQVVAPAIEVGQQDIEVYYQAGLDQYQRPESAHVLQILVATEDDADEVMAQLKDGVEFNDLARAKSMAPEAGKGGDLGWVVRGQLPDEMDEAVWKLEPGQVSDIVSTSYGFHVFKIVEHREPGLVPLEEVSERIAAHLREDLIDRAWEQYLDALRRKAHITINESLLVQAGGAGS